MEVIMEKLNLDYLDGKNLTKEMRVNLFIDYINKFTDVDYEVEANSDLETLNLINQVIKIIGNKRIAEAVLRVLNYNETFLIKNSLFKPVDYEKMSYILYYCLFGSDTNRETEIKIKKIDSLIFFISYLKNHPERLHYQSFNQYRREEIIDITSNNTKNIQNKILNEQKDLKSIGKIIKDYERILLHNNSSHGIKDLKIRFNKKEDEKYPPLDITNKETINHIVSIVRDYVNDNINPQISDISSNSNEYTNNDVINYIKEINDNLIRKFNPINTHQFTYIFWHLTGLADEEFSLMYKMIPKEINSKVFVDIFKNYKSFTKKIMR